MTIRLASLWERTVQWGRNKWGNEAADAVYRACVKAGLRKQIPNPCLPPGVVEGYLLPDRYFVRFPANQRILDEDEFRRSIEARLLHFAASHSGLYSFATPPEIHLAAADEKEEKIQVRASFWNPRNPKGVLLGVLRDSAFAQGHPVELGDNILKVEGQSWVVTGSAEGLFLQPTPQLDLEVFRGGVKIPMKESPLRLLHGDEICINRRGKSHRYIAEFGLETRDADVALVDDGGNSTSWPAGEATWTYSAGDAVVRLTRRIGHRAEICNQSDKPLTLVLRDMGRVFLVPRKKVRVGLGNVVSFELGGMHLGIKTSAEPTQPGNLTVAGKQWATRRLPSPVFPFQRTVARLRINEISIPLKPRDQCLCIPGLSDGVVQRGHVDHEGIQLGLMDGPMKVETADLLAPTWTVPPGYLWPLSQGDIVDLGKARCHVQFEGQMVVLKFQRLASVTLNNYDLQHLNEGHLELPDGWVVRAVDDRLEIGRPGSEIWEKIEEGQTELRIDPLRYTLDRLSA